MKKFDKQIKIKIDHHSLSKQDMESLDRWEYEGGKPSDDNEMYKSVMLPVKKGQIFEVVDGDLISENGELFYVVKLDLLSYS